MWRHVAPKPSVPGVSTFRFGDKDIRVVDLNGAPWFVAHDVCLALGMCIKAGTTRWTAGLLTDEKLKVLRRDHPQIFCGTNTNTLSMISESGLYRMVMRSDKPEAKAFQDWVTREVLPSIRKTPEYSTVKM